MKIHECPLKHKSVSEGGNADSDCLRGCIKYRQSLDRQLPEAPRVEQEFNDLTDN